MTARPKLAEKKGFDRLYSRAEIAAMTPREYRNYEASLKLYRDSLAVEETYRRQKRQAREEARAEGARDKSIEVAKNLKTINMSIEQIAQMTGLSVEEVAALD